MQPHSIKREIAAGSAVGVMALTLIASILLYELNAHGAAHGASQTAVNSPSTTPPGASSSSSSNSPSSAQNSGSSSATYKDGTYSANSSYYVPHGQESIKVTLTVQNGVVTNSDIQNSENDPESAMFQENFASEYKTYVVGKNIGSIQLSYVAGASDTTQGFNDALQNIISQAQS